MDGDVSRRRDELRTPGKSGGGGDADATPTEERWLEFTDSSLLAEDSKIGNDDEDEDANSQTFNFEARLGDLSCSLLDCEGGQHDDTLEESIVENLVSTLGKRDVTIAKLNNCLNTFMNQKGDGDLILNSVEKNLEILADGLKNSNFLMNSKPTWVKKAVDNNVASTQTEDLDTDFEDVQKTKSIRNFGTSISPAMFENFNSYREGSPMNLNFSRGTQEDLNQQEQESDTEDENKEADDSPPKRRLSFAMNPDSLRLTFSPSICEYEAESHCAPHDSSGPAIEDLRLQVIDTERKLEAEKRFLTEMTLEREQEREDFQRTINAFKNKYQDLRREKEKLENIVEHQKLEISELEEHFREKELVEDQLVNKDCQLQQAVEKVFELREIIRGQEELIESMTKQSKAAQDSKREASEVIEVDSDLSEACQENFQKDTSCMSEMDHAEELQAQVDELAKKIEEKLVELENFSWQNRPNSSCSVIGDDVSVRGTSRIPNCNESADARDFVSRVFCGLRRLECSFDGLVRFEEVLLKKMKDAELKAGIDTSKIDELKVQNGKLASDLNTCRQKIKDFEIFLKQTKRQEYRDSFSNHSIERLRNVVGVSFSKPFDNSSSPILRLQHNLRRYYPKMSNNRESCQPVAQTAESYCQNYAREKTYGPQPTRKCSPPNPPSTSCAPSSSMSACYGQEKCRADVWKMFTPQSTCSCGCAAAADTCRNPQAYCSPCGWFSSNAGFDVCTIQRLIPFCQSGKRAPKRPGLKIKGIGKKISNSTLHGIESVNDLRSWGTCKDDRRKHFLEIMNPELEEDVDHSFPISTTVDMQQQFEEEASVPSAPLKSVEAIIPPIAIESSKQFTASEFEPLEGAVSNPQITEDPVESLRQESQQFFPEESNPLEGAVSNPQVTETPVEPLRQESQQFFPEESKPLEDALPNPEITETQAGPSRKASLESPKSVPDQTAEVDVKKDPSVKKIPSKVELPRTYSSHDALNETEPVSSDEGIGKSLTQVTSDEKTEAGPEPIETEIVKFTTVSELEVADDKITYLGTEIVPEDALQPDDGVPPPPEDGVPPKEPDSEVLTIETTTDTIIEEPVNLDENIIPPEDLNSVVESTDCQTFRLEAMDVILELEKIKTQLAQTQQALDVEKQKSQILERTLNQISADSYQKQPGGDVSSFRDPTVEQEVSQLVNEVNRRHDQYVKHMNCALKTIKQLQDANDDLRAQNETLENGYQENGDQFYPDDQM